MFKLTHSIKIRERNIAINFNTLLINIFNFLVECRASPIKMYIIAALAPVMRWVCLQVTELEVPF